MVDRWVEEHSGWNWQRGDSVGPEVPGRLNHSIGWILLGAGVASAPWLVPGSPTVRNVPAVAGNPGIVALFGMAFVQLAVAQIQRLPVHLPRTQPAGARLTGLAAVVYAWSTILAGRWAGAPLLLLAGALLNFTGLVLVSWPGVRGRDTREPRAILATFCIAMFLHVVVETMLAAPNPFLIGPIGPADGMRLRMLRLARAAVLTLPVLTLLHHGLAVKADPHSPAVRWGRIGMVGGTILMAATLTAAGVTRPELRFLLPIPALATFVGTATGVWLARRHARPLELWGWFLIVGSMAGGLLVGLFAFGGPLPPPEFLGEYNTVARRVIRLAHIYSVIFGIVTIFISRELDRRNFPVRPLSGGSPS